MHVFWSVCTFDKILFSNSRGKEIVRRVIPHSSEFLTLGKQYLMKRVKVLMRGGCLPNHLILSMYFVCFSACPFPGCLGVIYKKTCRCGEYLNTPFFGGGEYEWQGSKVDTLGLTNTAFQSQAKVIHVDFENSGLEELFLLFGNY